jgi:addiction module HigA family antidote
LNVGGARAKNAMRPVHPGKILREDFLVPLGINANTLAGAIGVPPNRVGQILHGQRAITADTALRLARAFRTTPEFWLNLQAAYDLRLAERAIDLDAVRIVCP